MSESSFESVSKEAAPRDVTHALQALGGTDFLNDVEHRLMMLGSFPVADMVQDPLEYFGNDVSSEEERAQIIKLIDGVRAGDEAAEAALADILIRLSRA